MKLKNPFKPLTKLVFPDVIDAWLKKPNPAFDGLTPSQVVKRGKVKSVRRMVHELESGEPG